MIALAINELKWLGIYFRDCNRFFSLNMFAVRRELSNMASAGPTDYRLPELCTGR